MKEDVEAISVLLILIILLIAYGFYLDGNTDCVRLDFLSICVDDMEHCTNSTIDIGFCEVEKGDWEVNCKDCYDINCDKLKERKE